MRHYLFDADTFAAALSAKLASRKLDMRSAAKEIGCSTATISRVCAGKSPDVENYLRISRWLSPSRGPQPIPVAALDFAEAVGTPVAKTSGYPFPGEVRAAFTNRGGELRYVVEATGTDYAGMLHIFSPSQIGAKA